MPWFHADLRVHSCLSPQADLSASPRVLVENALDAGIQLLALTDTNSALNCPPFAHHARLAGITPLFGIEALSVDKVPIVALFDKLDQAMTLSEAWFRLLPHYPAPVGTQAQVSFDETIDRFVETLLSSRLPLEVGEIVAQIHAHAGLAIACRPRSRDIQLPTVVDGIEIDDRLERVSDLGWPGIARYTDDPVARFDGIFDQLMTEIAAIRGQPGFAWNDERLGGPALPCSLLASSNAYEPQWVGSRRTLFYAENPNWYGLKSAFDRGLVVGIWPLRS